MQEKKDIYGKIGEVLEIVKEIQNENAFVGDILLSGFQTSMITIQKIIEAGEIKEVDISEKIQLLSEILNLDLEDLVKHIIEKDFIANQDGNLVDKEEADNDTIDFILSNDKNINNTNSISDYEKFLKENGVKDNLDYLKEVI